VVLCEEGCQGAVASSWLQAKGFDSVQHLFGGIDAYAGSPCKEGVESSSLCSMQSGSAAFQL
jgi:predicted sulfurtransferase